jgi:hypothetical protein
MPTTETFRELADRRSHLKAEISAAQKQERKAKEELDKLDHDFIEKLEADGGTQWADHHHTFYISEITVPDVQDWDATYEYIKEDPENRLHLLQRRLTATAYRELLSSGVEVPGVLPFNRKTLNQRKK